MPALIVMEPERTLLVNMKRMPVAVGAAAALTLTLAACGGNTEDANPAQTPETTASAEQVDPAHNDADTMFAQMMIIHHEGAIEMADLAVEKASSQEVRTLAGDISAAQGPEIEQMTSWLQVWGEDTTPSGGMDHTGHGGMDMEGMSQEEAMAELEGLSGTEFDQRFLELMIAHHQGAVEMAQTQLADGENPQARELAQQIIDDQQAEISEMEGMLADLGQAVQTSAQPAGEVTGTVWVANEDGNSLSVIDTETNQVATTVTGIEAPHNVQVGQDGTVWAVSGHSNARSIRPPMS